MKGPRQLIASPAAHALRQRLGREGLCLLSSVSAGAQPLLAALLHALAPRDPLLVVVPDLRAQELFLQDLATWLKATGCETSRPLFFPAWEILPGQAQLPHVDVVSERLETLLMLMEQAREGPAPVVVTTPVALQQRTLSREFLKARTRALHPGSRTPLQELAGWLEEQGYAFEAQVTQKGEVSVRGGILDVFPLSSPWPVRIEYFGDEIESLRSFDPATQVSREAVSGVRLGPGGEWGLLRRQAASGGAPAAGSLLEHFESPPRLMLAEPDLLAEKAEQFTQEIPREGDPLVVSWSRLQIEWSGSPQVACSEAGFSEPDLDGEDPALVFGSLETYRPIAPQRHDPQVLETQRKAFFSQLHRWIRQGFCVEVFCNNPGEEQRFLEIWREYGLEEPDLPVPEVRQGALSRGFIQEAGPWVVVTDAEIFGRYKVQRPRRLKSPHAPAVRSLVDVDFSELEEGDYVVHLDHGIGRFLGLKVLPASGRKADAGGGEECLVLEYAASSPDKPAPLLYVPVSEAHLVSKYVGTRKSRPPLNTLGGGRWARAKAQAEKAVRDLASDLLSIQAARETQAGHPFPPDHTWQREFEASFLYEETPDQMRAILETKKDMESRRPMDRLICGDVGYGKTEVAIRAAFKAVMGGKQVAVLVPTTVLAQQHFNTFTERMADYPVRIELLSRFRTRREQQRVIEQAAAGTVDLVIGTHRLVQEDMAFKDLGLVIIDEEQRFGVMHKEKFKQLRRLVDVLTLSATPIPRTLYLALTGARDMSTIETPPQDRLPIQTVVTPFDERVVRDAILREIQRGGQVFFLHNRVSTIEAMAVRLQALVPRARILIGHGQMESLALEKVMTQFVNGEADVLLSTTIIESGIDIPNANTIIIDRADRFGLSELYQLRGRVGRYKHQAYAYLLLPRHARLLADARKRLSAIKQYSSLGSGFKIAMRDLEIRGAGNLLGAQQSGHITAVGFDLYCRLLKQSISALKGERIQPRADARIRIDFLAMTPAEVEPELAETSPEAGVVEEELAVQVGREVAVYVTEPALEEETESRLPRVPSYIPLDYVGEARQRVELYRKMAQASTPAEIQALRGEMRDRFGPLPEGVERLLVVHELRILASERSVASVETQGDKIVITRQGDFVMARGKFPRFTRKEPDARLKELRRLLLSLEPSTGPSSRRGKKLDQVS